MRIATVDVVAVALPFRERYVTSTGTLDRRGMLILRIGTGDGVVGHGDAVPMSLRGGADLSEVAADLEGPCREVLVSARLDISHPSGGAGAAIRPILAACREAGAGAEALSAVDIALLDLVGRLHGVPAWVVLGAPAARPVRCNGTLGADPPDLAADRARGLVDAGFETIKVKVGTGDDVHRMRAVRDACGADTSLRADANGAWDAEEAVTRLEEMYDVGLELAEQPSATLADLAEVRARVDVPVVADESVRTGEDAVEAVTNAACDAVTLKLAKVGGPHAACEVAARAPAYLSSALDSRLGIAAAVHTVQAMESSGFASGLAHGLATSSLFAHDVVVEDSLTGPLIEPPAGPGLGVDVDPDALDRLRIR